MKYYRASSCVHDVNELIPNNTYAICGIVGVFVGIKNDTVYWFSNPDGIEFFIEEYLLQDYMDNNMVNNIVKQIHPRKKYKN